MTRPTLIAAATALCLLTACSKQQDQTMAPLAMDSLPKAAAPAAPGTRSRVADTAAKVAAAAEAPVRRYRAVRHDLLLQTVPAEVEAVWRRAEKACEAAGCEVLGSVLVHDDERGPPSARLEARVPPERVEAFLQQVSALGSVGQHSKTAEDKTDEVIDTEAQLRNMAELRDKLRGLLANREARLRDLLEVERELARVQSDLDSLAARRKALAQQTDKVAVTLQIAARPALLQQGVWSPVAEAVTGAGHVLARSLASLIGFLVGAVPWALVLGAGIVGLRLALRRRGVPG